MEASCWSSREPRSLLTFMIVPWMVPRCFSMLTWRELTLASSVDSILDCREFTFVSI